VHADEKLLLGPVRVFPADLLRGHAEDHEVALDGKRHVDAVSPNESSPLRSSTMGSRWSVTPRTPVVGSLGRWRPDDRRAERIARAYVAHDPPRVAAMTASFGTLCVTTRPRQSSSGADRQPWEDGCVGAIEAPRPTTVRGTTAWGCLLRGNASLVNVALGR